ncbi:MAG: Crp/Fnr family transcriptional regulator [Chloroflexota bacterium]|jgi:CRP-like cAMP-binding protein|nr:MAG: Crp/Fnr family transcriptional regulator [Chloroflexota bacterium]
MKIAEEEIIIAQNSNLFRNIGSQGVEELVAAAQISKLNGGAHYFLEDDPADTGYLLLKGKVKLTQVTLEGQQVILGYLSPGRVFGIIAILKKVTYPVSAQAVGNCIALAWDQRTLNRLMERHPQIALNSLLIMAGQIREFQNRVRDLSTKRVETRLARAVLRLANQTGVKVPEGILIDLPLSRQDLAEMTGSTLYTVSRILHDWEEMGIVLSKRQKVVITNPHGLVSIAEDLPENQEEGQIQADDLCDI